jgi:hypothetical protein
MKLSLGVQSLLSFLVSVLLLVLLTLFESSLTGLSLTAERIISLLLLVLPALLGIVFGIGSIVRKESRRWIGILGITLNAVFALFHLFLLSFAG